MTRLFCVGLATVLLATSAFAGAALVSNVELSSRPGYAVAQIDVQGTVRFTHQTEEAKDGKPFRIIVDVLSARHGLKAKEFHKLPNCPIKSIRSSQYAVKPENVMRVVFDMDKETIYRVESDSKSIRVVIPDKEGTPFETWSTQAFLAGPGPILSPSIANTPKQPVSAPSGQPATKKKTTSELNAAIDKDRLASLQSSTKNQPKQSAASKPKPTQVATSKAAPKVAAHDPQPMVHQPEPVKPGRSVGPFSDKYMWSDLYTPPPKPVAKKAETPKPTSRPAKAEVGQQTAKQSPKTTSASAKVEFAKVDKPKPATTKTTPPKTGQPKLDKTGPKAAPASPAVARADKAEKTPAKPQSKPKFKVPAEPLVLASAANDLKSDPKPAEAAGEQTKPKTVKAKTPAIPDEKVAEPASEDKDAKKSTSRFRRSPAMSKKIKGTLVAEFPKRLVVKYKTSARRDPFETLINDSRVFRSPVEQRTPNVEGLRLVGVIEAESGGNSALFEDVDGYGYILNVGDKVQKGYVLRIDIDRVYFQIFEYGWSRTLALSIEE